MTLQGKARLVYALHFGLSDSPVQHRMWPTTLHTVDCKVLHNTLRQIRLLVVLTPGGCVAPTAVPSLVQTVYMGYEHTIIYGYLNPSTALTLKFSLKESLFCVASKVSETKYDRYWKCGTSVMSHKGSLINRGDTSEDTCSIWTPWQMLKHADKSQYKETAFKAFLPLVIWAFGVCPTSMSMGQRKCSLIGRCP